MSWWQGFNRFAWQISELQQIIKRRSQASHEEPENELPDAILSERERHEAVEREAERREQEGA